MQIIRTALIVKDYIQNLFEREEGQDLFEYLLIIGGISVVIIAAGAIAAPGLFEEIVEAVCEAVNDVDGSAGIEITSCSTLLP